MALIEEKEKLAFLFFFFFYLQDARISPNYTK